MGPIMGMGSSHWPAMIQPDEAKPWPFLRTLANDPRVPAALKDPLNWPEGVRAEWGEDEGVSALSEHRRGVGGGYRTPTAENEAFVNIQMYLDDDRHGFDVPIVPVQVNSYGSKIIRNRRAINGAGQEPDPISPTPRRCFRGRTDHGAYPRRQSMARGDVCVGRL